MSSKRKRRATIPQDIVEAIKSQIETAATEYDRNLTYEIDRSYVYVYAENKPLCRLGYTGNIAVWDFAIFKWSSERYSSSEFGFLSKGSVKECIEAGVNAYPKMEIRYSRLVLYLSLFLGLLIMLVLMIKSKISNLYRKVFKLA